jgi:rare lipoprotein A
MRWVSGVAIWLARLLPAVLLASCVPTPTPLPHYVLGDPYQAGGVWWYPQSNLQLDERGLAQVYDDQHAPLTTDGEVFDQRAMAAANQTLPLPAIARLTNLQTGRQVLVRINDRGPPTPRRMLAVTRRVAQLLGFPPGDVAQVRLEVLEGDSQAAQSDLAGAPTLSITAAPRGAVESTSLAPLPGAQGPGSEAGVGGARAVEAGSQTTPPATVETPAPAMRLPETITQVAPEPGTLWIDLGSFPTYEFANMQRAVVAQLGATIVNQTHGRGESFKVTIGPIPDVAQADRLLNEAVASGISSARIVVR